MLENICASFNDAHVLQAQPAHNRRTADAHRFLFLHRTVFLSHDHVMFTHSHIRLAHKRVKTRFAIPRAFCHANARRAHVDTWPPRPAHAEF
jgi:hypothetical protein